MATKPTNKPNAFELFDIEREMYEAQLQELRDEINTAQREVETLTVERRQAIEERDDDAMIDSFDERITEAHKRASRLSERLPVLERRTSERLRVLLPDVEAEAYVLRDEAEAKYNDMVRRLNAIKAQYLRTIYEVEAASKAVNSPWAAYRSRCLQAGLDQDDVPKGRGFFDGTMRQFYNSYTNMDDALWRSYCIPETVIRSMLEYGYVPKWADEVNGGEA